MRNVPAIKEAFEMMVVLPATTTDIGEHLSHEYASQKHKSTGLVSNN